LLKRLQCLVFGVALLCQASADQETATITLSELNLRKAALVSVLPAYPKAAMKNHAEGVLVAQITVNEKGNIAKIVILDTPAASIGKSAALAINRWRFQPFTVDGHAVNVTGKLTFYFRIDHQKAIVLNPMDAGYVGRWPVK
jgi:TonB family protein